MTRLIIGMSGSSGVIYGIRMLEVLAQHKEIETHHYESVGALEYWYRNRLES